MEYVKGKPYFFYTNSKIKNYNYLNKNQNCDILIIGGGINGCIANYYLSQKYNVVLVDKNRIGCSCTSCATSLLEYQLDNTSDELIKYMSKQEIINCYKLGLYSINKIENLLKKIGNKCYFYKRPTLIYSNSLLDKNYLLKEYNFRKNNGFLCNFIKKNNNFFNFDVNYGIFCKNGGAELDPYLFTKQLIENSKNQKNIFENTYIKNIKKINNLFHCSTNFNEKIICKNVILSTGFDFDFIPNNLVTRYTSYSIVTNPLKNLIWKDKTLIQDCKKPYHYLRFLPDNRLIFGGEDTLLKNNIDETLAMKKYKKLYNDLIKMFPNYKNKIKVEYCFCGAFGSTKNNLGLIGKDKNGIINFISTGANGIINAMRGIELVENILENKYDYFENLFSPLRKY